METVDEHHYFIDHTEGRDACPKDRCLCEALDELVTEIPPVGPLDPERRAEHPRLVAPTGMGRIELATALSLGEDLGVMIGYDERLLDARGPHDIPTASPH